jgi:hypothetical protein
MMMMMMMMMLMMMMSGFGWVVGGAGAVPVLRCAARGLRAGGDALSDEGPAGRRHLGGEAGDGLPRDDDDDDEDEDEDDDDDDVMMMTTTMMMMMMLCRTGGAG